MQTGLSLTDPLVGSRRRLRAGLREPGFEARLAKPRVIAGKESAFTHLYAVVPESVVKTHGEFTLRLILQGFLMDLAG